MKERAFINEIPVEMEVTLLIPVLEKKQIQQDIESRVKDWLKSSNASYLENVDSSVLGSEKIDFLVTQPFPIAIEVLWADPKAWTRKAKRMLAQRINIAASN